MNPRVARAKTALKKIAFAAAIAGVVAYLGWSLTYSTTHLPERRLSARELRAGCEVVRCRTEVGWPMAYRTRIHGDDRPERSSLAPAGLAVNLGVAGVLYLVIRIPGAPTSSRDQDLPDLGP